MIVAGNFVNRITGDLPGPRNQTLLRLDKKDMIPVTLELMRKLARIGSKKSVVRDATMQALQGLRERDFVSEIESVLRWLKDNIRFVRDPVGTELLQTPEKTLSVQQGDCDDIAILAAAMLRSVGFNSKFVTIGKKRPSHVFTTAVVGKRIIQIDPSRPDRVDLRGFKIFDVVSV